jgi:hypothetical protein
MRGEEMAEAMLRAAGFWELEEHRLPHHPMNVCFVARTAVERARPGVGATFWSQPSVPATVRIRSHFLRQIFVANWSHG